MGFTDSRSLSAWAAAMLWVAIAAGPAAALTELTELVIDEGVVVFGPLDNPSRGAEVDINRVYANHPAFMRMQELGLDVADSRGKTLFAQAKKSVKSALAAVAESEDLHVITDLGGVSGGDIEILDQSQKVIDLLPVYHIDGAVLSGTKKARANVAEMDKEAVLQAIPAYRDWLNLDPSDTRYHFLKEEWNLIYQEALSTVVRNESLEAVAEPGAITSRLEAAPVITDRVIEALEF